MKLWSIFIIRVNIGSYILHLFNFFNLCNFIPITCKWVREGVTIIIKGSSRSGMEEVVSYAALWFCVHVVWKSSKKRVHMRLRRELNVYEYFVMATFSTWMNGGAKVQVTGQVTRKVTGHRSHKNNRTLDKTVLDWYFIIKMRTQMLIQMLIR